MVGDSQDHAPAFQDIAAWINSDPVTLEGLEGDVVLLEFWTYACTDCRRTLPDTKALWDAYRDQGLTVIGMHSPRFEFEAAAENVRDAVDRLGIDYPVALDAQNTTWKLYGGQYWPRRVLIDHEGRIRHETIGDGGRGRLEERLRRLIRWNGGDLNEPVFDVDGDGEDGRAAPLEAAISPDVHAGEQRGDALGNADSQVCAPYTRISYEDPGDHALNRLYLNGEWTREKDCVTLGAVGREDACYAVSRCSARTAHAVMAAGDTPVRVNVTLNGDPVPAPLRGDALQADANGTYIRLSRPDTYQIVDRETMGVGDIGLHPRDPGFQLYAFTFE